MKTSFSNFHDVMHLFAQRTQLNAKSSNVFFESSFGWDETYGNKIYSYGHHYLLAQFIKNKNDELAILINDDGYSNTTSKHIGAIIQATRQYKQFRKSIYDSRNVIKSLERLLISFQKAKKPEMYKSEAFRIISGFNDYLNWKGEKSIEEKEALKKIKKLKSVFSIGNVKEYQKQEAARIKREISKKKKQEEIIFQNYLKLFFDYEIDFIWNNPTGEDFLRISQDQNFVETTQKISITVKDAKVLYLLIQAGKDIKGFNLCGYTVIGLNGTLKIGCHHINVKNMHFIGEQLLKMDI